MAEKKIMSFSELMRQQLNAKKGFGLIEDAIADCQSLRKEGPTELRIPLSILQQRLNRALSLVRDIKPDVTPRDVEDGLHAHLREAHEWLECVLSFFFVFQKEWEQADALELEAHCAGLHEASVAIVKHLEEVGFK